MKIRGLGEAVGEGEGGREKGDVLRVSEELVMLFYSVVEGCVASLFLFLSEDRFFLSVLMSSENYSCSFGCLSSS